MKTYAIDWSRIHMAATLDLFRYYQDSRIADKPFEHYGAVVDELNKRGVVREDPIEDQLKGQVKGKDKTDAH